VWGRRLPFKMATRHVCVQVYSSTQVASGVQGTESVVLGQENLKLHYPTGQLSESAVSGLGLEREGFFFFLRRGFFVHYLDFFFFFFFFAFIGAHPPAYGDWKARGRIRAIAAHLHHTHSNVRSEPRLQPTLQLTAMPDP